MSVRRSDNIIKSYKLHNPWFGFMSVGVSPFLFLLVNLTFIRTTSWDRLLLRRLKRLQPVREVYFIWRDQFPIRTRRGGNPRTQLVLRSRSTSPGTEILVYTLLPSLGHWNRVSRNCTRVEEGNRRPLRLVRSEDVPFRSEYLKSWIGETKYPNVFESIFILGNKE